MRASDVSLLTPGLLEFDDADGHAVAVQHDVEPALEVALHDPHLVDRKRIVIVGLGADEADRGRDLGAVRINVGDAVEPIDEVVV